MAENVQTGGNNLDDFFAKKDKSKKKTKSSKFTVDDILQAKTESEEKSKKVRPSKKKEKDANRSGDKTLGAKAEGEDEEWNEIEEEAEKDYSGLRVQNLQISSKADEERQDAGSQRNDDGDDAESKEAAQGPWKPVPAVSAPSPPVAAPAPPEPDTTSREAPPKTTGKYVPPQMRRAAHGDQPAVTSSGPSRLSRGKKTAPDVHSQEDFPTLGSPAEPSDGAAFEKIRGGARPVEDPAMQHARLSLDNKFDALGAEHS